MGAANSKPSGPDFAQGVPADQVADGSMLAGHVGDEGVLVARHGNELFAIGTSCTHYGGPLAEGLMVGDTVRCPWHHACFSLRTGEPLRAPALDPVACWRVERVGDTVYAREKLPEPRAHDVKRSPQRPGAPSSIVIVGGGGAGLAAADMLRREGYDGSLVMLSADDAPPCDRPNLSKDFLAGTAQEDWIPLRPPEFYTERRIELVLNARVSSLDAHEKRVQL